MERVKGDVATAAEVLLAEISTQEPRHPERGPRHPTNYSGCPTHFRPRGSGVERCRVALEAALHSHLPRPQLILSACSHPATVRGLMYSWCQWCAEGKAKSQQSARSLVFDAHSTVAMGPQWFREIKDKRRRKEEEEDEEKIDEPIEEEDEEEEEVGETEEGEEEEEGGEAGVVEGEGEGDLEGGEGTAESGDDENVGEAENEEEEGKEESATCPAEQCEQSQV